MGVRYSALPGHTAEIADALNDVLSEKWANLRGVEIVSFGVNSVKASEEDEAMIKELQKNAVFRNANMAAAHLVGAQAQAMQDAAKNQGGAFTGFMGMNMAQQGGGVNAAQLFQMGAQQQTAGPPAAGSAERGRVDVRLRRDGHRQILPGVRREEARSQACGGLDVRLRRGQHRQILLGMRREAARGRAGLLLRQMRLEAR